MSDNSISNLIERMSQHDWRALSRAITVVENNYDGKKELLDYAYQSSKENCLILGITGAGGAGKSTVIDSVLHVLSGMGKQVGVIAVDPSSSYTGGAVLGDRIRMGRHSLSEGIFIRSLASRGSLGGISQGAKDVLYLYKSFGFDVIILESYGVGQAETDITSFVDVTTVVTAPGNGDYIQHSKAGTQESADIFVVNKADNPEADLLYVQMTEITHILPENMRPVVLKMIAREHKGTEELVRQFYDVAEKLLPNRNTKKRTRVMNEIQSNAMKIFDDVLKRETEAMMEDVLDGKVTPFEAAKLLGERICLKGKTFV